MAPFVLRKLLTITALVATLGVSLLPLSARGQMQSDKFPRLANYYLNPDMTVAQAEKLARWDVVILGAELQYTNPAVFTTLREKNPNITILVYVPSEEIPLSHAQITDPNHPYYQLYQGIDPSWWLTDASGGFMQSWPATRMLNVTDAAVSPSGERWNTYLPTFVHDHYMSTKLWDGIFFDNVWPGIAWLNNGAIDSNKDGVNDDATVLDAAWRDGMAKLIARSRELEGKDTIIIGNGSGQYYNTLNGRILEDFPSDNDGGWSGAMQTYFDVLKRAYLPPYLIINGISRTGSADDYQSFRFDLASTLLGNGYFSFDKGAQEHAALWIYDEYSTSLGMPQNSAYNVFHPKQKKVAAGVWRRDFQNGVVLVNATASPRTVELLDGFEKLTGTQVTSVNSGKIISTIKLGAHDGIILLRRQYTLASGQFSNGSFARAFSASGKAVRQGFYTYDDTIAGGADVIKQDMDGDGRIETVFSRGNLVYVLNHDGFLQKTFAPFGKTYSGTLNLATGDFDGNGNGAIIVATGMGFAPRIRVFSVNGRQIRSTITPFPKQFRGGVSVAAGDVNGDGVAEIVAGAGPGGGPQVRVFGKKNNVIATFLAFAKTFRGGVSVAAGDLNGDGKTEIVAGTASQSNGKIRIFNGKGKKVLPGFSAFATKYIGTARVSVADINQDLKNEIIVFSPTVY